MPSLVSINKFWPELLKARKNLKVVYQTARMDLLQLEEIGVLTKTKVSKKFVYTVTDLDKLLEKY